MIEYERSPRRGTPVRAPLIALPPLQVVPRRKGTGKLKWDSHGAALEDCLSELADYHIIHEHCNVPKIYSENTKLAQWVGTHMGNYKWFREGKTSSMTTFRIKVFKA
jgi:hypothetical protein